MSGSTFGQSFRVTTFGESHGVQVGAVVDGCPPQIPLAEGDIQPDLDRRRPGQSKLSSARKEGDAVRIVSGVFEGKTTGTPIGLIFDNQDAKSSAYEHMRDIYRPSHADFTYDAKFGHRAWPGGGRASARETVARVAAGAVARRVLYHLAEVEIVACIVQVQNIAANVDMNTVRREDVIGQGPIQCPDPQVAQEMVKCIEQVRKDGDTVGGVIACVARNVPAGLGNPVFDKLDADLAKAMLSLPSAKGFEIGSGFSGTRLLGSEHNDPFAASPSGDGVITTRNASGGIQGGISNGMPILMRVAFKPVATHFKVQNTVNTAGEEVTFQASGRHDPCVLPRAVVIVESMAALTLCDALLRHRAQVGD